jgi:hypothetical protein
MRLYARRGFVPTGAIYLDGVYEGYEDWVIDMKKDI